MDLFQEAYTLNPTSQQAAEYLRLAQIEELKVRLAEQEAMTPTGDVTATAGGSPAAVTQGGATSGQRAVTGSSQLTTTFTHPFTDGRLVVRVGGDIVANETLFAEKPGGLFRRATREPRAVNVTRAFPAKNAEVQVWVVVPAQGINEHKTLPARRFDGGTPHRLSIVYDQASKKFSYSLD
jgi:hypothetical protein